MLSHNDVTNLAIPLGLYPSKDESVDEVCEPFITKWLFFLTVFSAVEANPGNYLEEVHLREERLQALRLVGG